MHFGLKKSFMGLRNNATGPRKIDFWGSEKYCVGPRKYFLGKGIFEPQKIIIKLQSNTIEPKRIQSWSTVFGALPNITCYITFTNITKCIEYEKWIFGLSSCPDLKTFENKYWLFYFYLHKAIFSYAMHRMISLLPIVIVLRTLKCFDTFRLVRIFPCEFSVPYW